MVVIDNDKTYHTFTYHSIPEVMLENLCAVLSENYRERRLSTPIAKTNQSQIA